MVSTMTSLKGHLLVAAPKLVDPNFFHSVVLIVQHDEERALGVVLNRPLQTTIREMWQEVSERECALEGPLHQGGPCEGPLMVVHGRQKFAEIEVGDGVYFCTSRDRIEGLIEEGGSETAIADIPMKFFVGYAGWTQGQLESEIAEGSWLTVTANAQAVFEGDEHLWTDLIRALSRAAVTSMVDPKRIPDDPSVN